MIYLIFFVLVLGTTLFLYMMRNFNHWKKLGVRFIQPLPVFGNTLDILLMKQNIGEFCKSVYDTTSDPLIGFFFIDEPHLLIRDLDTIKCILIRDFDVFMDRSIADNKKYDTVGSNLLFLMKSPQWNSIRRKLTPIYSPKRIRAMSELMKVCGQEMVEYINEECLHNKVFDVKILFEKFAVEAVTSVSYGLEGNCFRDNKSPFNAIAGEVFNWNYTWQAIKLNCFFIAPKVVKLFRMKFVDTATGDFFRELFWNTIRQRESTKIFRDDVIDLLIKYRNPDPSDDIQYLDGDVLVAQALGFFTGGVETTSSTLSFALIELAQNNEIQNKLRREIQSVKEGRTTLSYDDIQRMDYLEKVIFETLRKYPILPFLDRRCSKAYNLPDSSLTLEEGTAVYISILGIHYDEKYYPEPHRFDPDRFNKENVDGRHSMAFLPFGDGPRGCLGKRFALLAMSYVLANILSNFEVRIPEQTERKSWSHNGITLQPEGEAYIEFIKL